MNEFDYNYVPAKDEGTGLVSAVLYGLSLVALVAMFL